MDPKPPTSVEIYLMLYINSLNTFPRFILVRSDCIDLKGTEQMHFLLFPTMFSNLDCIDLKGTEQMHFLLFPTMFSNLSFPKRQILDSSNLKEFADNNFKFDENGREFSKRVENTVGKGEIAHYEHFLLFQQCFLPIWITCCHFRQI